MNRFNILFTILAISRFYCSSVEAQEPRNWPCPEQSTISPCVCFDDGSANLDLDCSDVYDEAELHSALENCAEKFPFMDFREFTIYHDGSQNLSTLSAETLCLLSFKYIDIQGTELTVIEENVFSQSENTSEDWILSNNKIYSFPFETLELYYKLDTLDLTDNDISSLPSLVSDSLRVFKVSENENLDFASDVYQQTPNLEEVYMNFIDLAILEAGVFDLSALSVVSLYGNELVSLRPGSFNGNGFIFIIDLSDNMITDVAQDAFNGMMEGASIIMSENELQFIYEDVWQPVIDQVNTTGNLDFSDNPIRCGCELEWLVDSSDNMAAINNDTSCYSGSPLLGTLPASAFDYHCHHDEAI